MDTYLREQVAASLREAMAGSGVTQDELARRVGSHSPAVSRALSGRQNLTLETVERYFDALGLRVSVVVDGTSPAAFE